MVSALGRDGSTREWRVRRAAVMRRDHMTCQYCGAVATSVDHIVPRVMGGGDSMDNLVACCAPCQYRGDKQLVFKRRRVADTELSVLSTHSEASQVVTRDYTRREEPA